jgi:hypothetical protein
LHRPLSTAPVADDARKITALLNLPLYHACDRTCTLLVPGHAAARARTSSDAALYHTTRDPNCQGEAQDPAEKVTSAKASTFRHS